MRNYFSNLNKEILDVIRLIADEADKKNLSSYLAGGIVRDLILKKKNLDLDVVIEKNAIDIAQIVKRKLKGTLVVHSKFKTATLELSNGLRVDFATARNEIYSKPGALPTIKKGTLSEDLFRRDFTINAMGLCINRSRFGQLIDEFDGLKDLKAKKIRVLHPKSFVDDPTRILRAVRFEQRFGFKIEPATVALLKEALKKNYPSSVSMTRYFGEFKKILLEMKPSAALRRLKMLNALKFVSPNLNIDLPLLSSLDQKIMHLKRRKGYCDFDQWWMLYFMGLLMKSNQRVLKAVASKLPLTKEEKRDLLYLCDVKNLARTLSMKGTSRSEVHRLLRELPVSVLFFLRVIVSNKIGQQNIDRFVLEDVNTKLLISGKDLKKVNGVSGKKIGEVLEEILGQKIEGNVKNRSDELKLAFDLLDCK